MNSPPELPYELHTHGAGMFVSFKITDEITLPLTALARATFRTAQDGDQITLDFQTVEIVIIGRALALMLEHLLAGRVKRISCARDPACEIESIKVRELS